MFFAGIDWADDHYDAVVVNEAGKSVGSTHVSHSPEGMANLRRFLLSIAGDPESIPCFVETNNGLLITSLLEMGFPVYPMNPKTVDRRRKPSGAKTDGIDACLLARTGRSDFADLRQLKPDSPIVLELKILTRNQDVLIHTQTRLVNQLTACLKAYYPAALELFTKLHQPITLAFLQAYPTPKAALGAPIEQISALLKEHHHPTPNPKAQKIFKSSMSRISRPIPLPPGLRPASCWPLSARCRPFLSRSRNMTRRSGGFLSPTLTVKPSTASRGRGSSWHQGSW